jgi:iron(III) transport system ATP-binding protein
LLLFDEPLSNLDVTLREETRGELRELVTRLGLTAVYVTHDQEEAFALCDRIAVMFQGEILQNGKPRDLYERPAHVSVARFLGRNNLIRAMRLSAMKTETGEFKTLDGGHVIRLPVKVAELPPLNQPCTLAIRPEHVVITKDEDMRENVFPARVFEIQFAGATTTIKLDANGLRLEALMLSNTDLVLGDNCAVALPPDRITLLKV